MGRHVLVAGAGGAGARVVQALLADAALAQVTVLTTQRFLSAPSRLACALVPGHARFGALPSADHAVIVLGARPKARERVCWQPARADLLPLAVALRAIGVGTLEVLLADGSTLSRHESDGLHALGFAHWQVLAPPDAPNAATAGPRRSWPERLALWLIRSLLATLQMAQGAYRPSSARTRSARGMGATAP